MDERLGHEQAAFLALGLLAWLVEKHTGKPVRVLLSTKREDRALGTDVCLVLPRARHRPLVVFIDLTTGGSRLVGRKIKRSVDKSRAGGRYVEIIRTELSGPVMDVEIAPGFMDAFRRLRSIKATSFSPVDIGEPKLVAALLCLGADMVVKLGHRPHYQSYFKVDGRWVWELPLPK